jgi:alpha-mannosidase
VEGADFSAALMSKGLLEVEARPDAAGSTILLTLLRCVGWLSRSDLATRRGGAGPELETPDAQELGPHQFEFAVATFHGSYLDGDLIQRVEAYTSAPRLFQGCNIATLGESGALVKCDNPRIVFSTARPESAARSYKVRVYSASPNAERAKFTFAGTNRARLVDLAGRAVKSPGLKRSRDGALTLEVRPFQILTFEVRPRRAPKKNSPIDRQKD